MVPPVLYYGTALKKAKWLLLRGFIPKAEERIHFAIEPITSIWFAERASDKRKGNGPTIVAVNTNGIEECFKEDTPGTWYIDKPITKRAVKIYKSSSGFASFKKKEYADAAKKVRVNPLSVLEQVKDFIAKNKDSSGPRNAWFRDRKMTVYIRKGWHKINGKVATTFDIASVEVFGNRKGKGIFTRFVEAVHKLHPWEATYIEQVHNERLRGKLHETGWHTEDSDYDGFSFWKKKDEAPWREKTIRDNPKSSLVSVIPYRVGSAISLKKMWRQFVLKKGFEGLVVTEQQGSYMQVQKVKTLFTVDAVVIAMNTTGKTWSRGMFGSLLLGLMDKKGRILEIGDMSGGDFDFKTRWRKKLAKDVTHTEGGYAFVTPKHVFEVKYLDTLPATTPHTLYKIKGNRLREIGVSPYKMFSMRSPSFVRVREDKSVNQHDIRIEQIPELVGGSGRRLLLKAEDNPYPVWDAKGKSPSHMRISMGGLVKMAVGLGHPILVHDEATAKKVIEILKSGYGITGKLIKRQEGWVVEYQ